MLELAYVNKDELQKEFLKTKFDEKYKYYSDSYELYTQNISDSSWNRLQFVSKNITTDNKESKIIGYLSADVDRCSNNITSLALINFDKPSFAFAKDLISFIELLLIKHQFNKISWNVNVGNPIEKSYDKICTKNGGRIVGIQKQHTKLWTGEICDVKIYEIMREDYLIRFQSN